MSRSWWVLFPFVFQLDLRVNHTLIKDQFLWVRIRGSFSHVLCTLILTCSLTWPFAGPEQFREWSWGICKDLVQGFRCWRSWSWSKKIIALSFLILPSVIKQSSVSNVWYKVMCGFFSSFFPFSWSLLLHLQSENNFTRWMKDLFGSLSYFFCFFFGFQYK